MIHELSPSKKKKRFKNFPNVVVKRAIYLDYF